METEGGNPRPIKESNKGNKSFPKKREEKKTMTTASKTTRSACALQEHRVEGKKTNTKPKGPNTRTNEPIARGGPASEILLAGGRGSDGGGREENGDPRDKKKNKKNRTQPCPLTGVSPPDLSSGTGGRAKYTSTLPSKETLNLRFGGPQKPRKGGKNTGGLIKP